MISFASFPGSACFILILKFIYRRNILKVYTFKVILLKFIYRRNILKVYTFKVIFQLNSEHRELYSNMGMRIEYTIFLMMRLKSFRPEIDKKLAAPERMPKIKKKSPINDFKTKMISWTSKKWYLSNKRQ